MNRPTTLIFDIRDSYTTLVTVITDPTLPTIDEDAIMSRIVDALRYRYSTIPDLYHLRMDMLNGEGMVEKQVIEDLNNSHYFSEEIKEFKQSLDRIANAARDLGMELHNQFRVLGLYEDDYFNYEYQGMLNHGSLILRRCVG